jgi:parallel beta-helix repeat protein
MVLCSDGLTDMLSSSEIQRIVHAHAGDPKTCVARLIEKANVAGGRDNISVIVVEGEEFAAAARRAMFEAGWSARPPEDVGALSWWRGPAGFLLGILCGIALMGLWQWRQQEKPAPTPIPASDARRVLRVRTPEFPTIASALAGARPGDYVEAPAGEYRETIQLRPGVTLAAREPGKAIIVVSNPAPPELPAVLAQKVHQAAFLGFVIRGGATLPIGLRITDADVTVSDVEITGTTTAGVWVDGDSRPVLTGMRVHSNSGAGIVIGGTSAPRLLGNVIQTNGVGSRRAAPGIQIIDEAKPAMSKNVISGNGAEGIRIRRPDLRQELMDNFFGNGAPPNKRGAIGTEKLR